MEIKIITVSLHSKVKEIKPTEDGRLLSVTADVNVDYPLMFKTEGIYSENQGHLAIFQDDNKYYVLLVAMSDYCEFDANSVHRLYLSFKENEQLPNAKLIFVAELKLSCGAIGKTRTYKIGVVKNKGFQLPVIPAILTEIKTRLHTVNILMEEMEIETMEPAQTHFPTPITFYVVTDLRVRAKDATTANFHYTLTSKLDIEFFGETGNKSNPENTKTILILFERAMKLFILRLSEIEEFYIEPLVKRIIKRLSHEHDLFGNYFATEIELNMKFTGGAEYKTIKLPEKLNIPQSLRDFLASYTDWIICE